jgi:FkbM family methyltransferase
VGIGRVADRVSAHGRSYLIRAPNPIAHFTRLGDPYEQPLLEQIYAQGFAGTAVDVGAHVGNHTLWLAAICGLKVDAIEPVLHRELRDNVELNRLQDVVRVHPFALGERSGTAHHTGPFGRLAVGDGAIEVRRLDDLDLRDVSVIKIDVEGMEAAVIAGGERTIRRDAPMIYAEEWLEPQWHSDIAAVLEPWGYRMTYKFESPEAWTPLGRWECHG